MATQDDYLLSAGWQAYHAGNVDAARSIATSVLGTSPENVSARALLDHASRPVTPLPKFANTTAAATLSPSGRARTAGASDPESLASIGQVVGPFLVVVGLVLVAIGFSQAFASFQAFGGQSAQPAGSFLIFFGVILIGVGGFVTKWAYLGVAARYIAREVSPAVTELANATRAASGSEPRCCSRCQSLVPFGAVRCPVCLSTAQR